MLCSWPPRQASSQVLITDDAHKPAIDYMSLVTVITKRTSKNVNECKQVTFAVPKRSNFK